MEERVTCSAIWYKELPTMVHLPKNVEVGMVVCGHRHSNCINVVKTLAELRTVKLAEDGVGDYVEGFLTNKNRFVDRVEGANIALACGQVKELQWSSTELYSEDLY